MSYRITSKREYVSAMGIVCFLVLTAFAVSWLIEGKFDVRLQGIGDWTFRREVEPVGFWLLAGFIATLGATGTIVSGLAFSRARREPKTPQPNNKGQKIDVPRWSDSLDSCARS